MSSGIPLLTFVTFLLSSCSPVATDHIPYPECEQSKELSVHPVGYFDTKLQGYWSARPNIRICPSSGLSVERVQIALGFWRDLGYEFGEIITSAPAGRIQCAAQPGEIAFRLPTQREISQAVRESKLGVAKTAIDTTTNKIISSDIYFQTTIASHTAKLVEHEIGHALGWEHHNYANHIMHHSLQDSGYSSIGIEKRRYDRLAEQLNEELADE